MPGHPSKDIIGTKGKELAQKRIVLCITGSVGAVDSPRIARELMRHGAEVFGVMTEMAQHIIHPDVVEWATGNPVVTKLTGKIEHIALAGNQKEKADLILVAPATANTISKIACGIDDTPVTTLASTSFGSRIPLVIVPAMHDSLYSHPLVVENMEKLRTLGVTFVNPRTEDGKAKIAEADEIISAVERRLNVNRDLEGIRVLVTGGATIEFIDPIRILTNLSSGKMGVALAEEARNRGANVTLILGERSITCPKDVNIIKVTTTQEMSRSVWSELKRVKYDILVAAAAVADWTPEKPFSQKVSTHGRCILSVQFKPTKKIIDAVKKISPDTFLVAFRAEHKLSENALVASAFNRLTQANADLIVANDVSKSGAGFRTDTNEVFIVDRDKKVVHIPLASKQEVARQIFDLVTEKTKSGKARATKQHG